jgi:y4mF family transcriptional regulator
MLGGFDSEPLPHNYSRSGIFALRSDYNYHIFPVREKSKPADMKETNNLPFGNISTAEDLGRCVRAQRKSQGATQAEFASLCGVGVRFISELENGKPTMELGKVLKVLKCLGLDVSVQPRGWNHAPEKIADTPE